VRFTVSNCRLFDRFEILIFKSDSRRFGLKLCEIRFNAGRFKRRLLISNFGISTTICRLLLRPPDKHLHQHANCFCAIYVFDILFRNNLCLNEMSKTTIAQKIYFHVDEGVCWCAFFYFTCDVSIRRIERKRLVTNVPMQMILS